MKVTGLSFYQPDDFLTERKFLMTKELTDLAVRAQTIILTDHRTREHGIEVREKDGVIVLMGSVPSRKIKRIASSIIRELQDVSKVDNKLEVRKDEILKKILR